jgi:hypothetical protein
VEQFVENTVLHDTDKASKIIKESIETATGVRDEMHAHSDKTRAFYSSSVHDVTKFSQTDFKSEAPTGHTPAKKTYVSQIELVKTKPHEVLIEEYQNRLSPNNDGLMIVSYLSCLIYNSLA